MSDFDRLRRKLADLPAAARKEIVLALDESAASLQKEAKTGIETGKRSGRIYRRAGESHQASAPGEFPKSWTGYLVQSIFKRVLSSSLEAQVGTYLDYGKFLEFGTSRMQARPWLRPSFLKVAPAVRDRMYLALGNAVRQVAR